MIYRCILPNWDLEQNPNKQKVFEGSLDEDTILDLNNVNYNIYYLPNYPSTYDGHSKVDGSQVDSFEFIFVDMDLKENKYKSKDDFILRLSEFDLPPTKIVDSGNGVHAYWRVTDLTAMTYLKLQRRLCRFFNTDQAVSKIYQLMRVPNTLNTKDPNHFKVCESLYDSEDEYTSEQLDGVLPQLSREDEEYCQEHYKKTYEPHLLVEMVDAELPKKFGKLLRQSKEVKEIWLAEVDDRSESDYRLGHILFASGYTREEAMSVLVNCPKAITRAPKHRIAYAQNIVDKIWTYELTRSMEGLDLSESVESILATPENELGGQRFPTYSYFDNTEHGFRLGQVLGLIGGSGVGKTAFGLNMFMGFTERNPNYEHFIVLLEQPKKEVAEQWKKLCGKNTGLHKKVHIISNYDKDGNFRQLSFSEIRKYLINFQNKTKKKIGCVMIDHIGALKKEGKNGENQSLMEICHEMKGFAIQLDVFLLMQSQSSREKASIGDLELNKDAAYGTMYFEAYCDYLVTLWQPLKRCYDQPKCPTVTAFKFCKIRHKNQEIDEIREDVRYKLFFEPKTGQLREMTQFDDIAFEQYNKRAVNLRSNDRRTELVTYVSIKTTPEKEKTHNEERV